MPAYAADCLPGATTRGCTAFELPRAVNGTCPCPGAGTLAAFTLTVGYVYVPGLGNATRRLVGANGTVPGPAIVVDEGDWVVVDVTNALDVPTVVHWHGMLHVGTPFADGVPGVSQCLVPPGDSLRYTFRASLPGTYWYHGHHDSQYVEGLHGPLIIRPRGGDAADVHADVDATLMVMDYYQTPANELMNDYFLTPASGGAEPVPDATAVNGAFTRSLAIAAARGQQLRLRFFAANALRMFSVSIDGLPLSIVEIDGTAVVPLEVRSGW